MQKALRSILVAGLLAAVVAIGAVILASSPVSAQAPGAAVTFNFSGDYAPVFHEDQPERLGGPDIGDYLGLPINDGARLQGDTWDGVEADAARASVQAAPVRLHPRGPANLRIWEDIDHHTQQLIAFHTHISWQAPERTIWMDGRPASARICRAHLAGLLHG